MLETGERPVGFGVEEAAQREMDEVLTGAVPREVLGLWGRFSDNLRSHCCFFLQVRARAWWEIFIEREYEVSQFPLVTYVG